MAVSVPWGELTIAGLLGGLIGGLTGAFITHWLATRRDKKKEFRDAGRQFRETFIELERLLSIRHPMPSNLYPGAPDEYKNIVELLPRWYQQQFAALLKFESYLSKSKQKKLRQIWDECFCVDQVHKYPIFTKYETGGDHNIEMQNRDTVIQKIQRMFNYTQ